MKTAVARHWRLGVLTFLIVLGLCSIATWRRPVRHNVVFAFAARTIDRGIDLPSTSAINPQNIQNLLKLSLEERALFGSVFHQGGTFTVIVDSVPEQAAQRVQQELSAIYQRLVEQLTKEVDPTPLTERVGLLETQLDLVEQTLESSALSPYERYALEREALILKADRKEARGHLETVSEGLFDPPTSQLYGAKRMPDGVLLLLSLVLAGFVACAAVILADSSSTNE